MFLENVFPLNVNFDFLFWNISIHGKCKWTFTILCLFVFLFIFCRVSNRFANENVVEFRIITNYCIKLYRVDSLNNKLKVSSITNDILIGKVNKSWVKGKLGKLILSSFARGHIEKKTVSWECKSFSWWKLKLFDYLFRLGKTVWQDIFTTYSQKCIERGKTWALLCQREYLLKNSLPNSDAIFWIDLCQLKFVSKLISGKCTDNYSANEMRN